MRQATLAQRKKRVVYVARFIPAKRHEILKQLARDLPDYEFVSVGGLIDAEKDWFNRLQTRPPSQLHPENQPARTRPSTDSAGLHEFTCI